MAIGSALLAIPLLAGAVVPTPQLNIVVIGDSFSAPTPGLTMWPALVGQKLHANVTDFAVPGSGYLAPGLGAKPEQFITQVIEAPVQADVVIIFGSTNDKTATPAQIKKAVAETMTVARAVYPKAKLIVAGPQSAANNTPAPPAEVANRNVVHATARGDQWDDTINLFRGVTNTAGPDNFHPNQSGQQLLADHFSTLITN